MDGIDYTKLGEAPPEYKCGNCGASNVKLWREYNTFGPKLFCVLCASRLERVPIHDFDEHLGKHTDKRGFFTDQIGSLVPAVPDEEGVGYWGYTSVPWPGVNWWYHLKGKQ